MGERAEHLAKDFYSSSRGTRARSPREVNSLISPLAALPSVQVSPLLLTSPPPLCSLAHSGDAAGDRGGQKSQRLH